MGKLLSGTGRAKKDFTLNGLQAREPEEPLVVLRVEIACCLHQGSLTVVLFANPGRWGEFSVLSHEWLFGAGQGAVCSTVVGHREKRAGGSRGARDTPDSLPCG